MGFNFVLTPWQQSWRWNRELYECRRIFLSFLFCFFFFFFFYCKWKVRGGFQLNSSRIFESGRTVVFYFKYFPVSRKIIVHCLWNLYLPLCWRSNVVCVSLITFISRRIEASSFTSDFLLPRLSSVSSFPRFNSAVNVQTRRRRFINYEFSCWKVLHASSTSNDATERNYRKQTSSFGRINFDF